MFCHGNDPASDFLFIENRSRLCRLPRWHCRMYYFPLPRVTGCVILFAFVILNSHCVATVDKLGTGRGSCQQSLYVCGICKRFFFRRSASLFTEVYYFYGIGTNWAEHIRRFGVFVSCKLKHSN